MGFEARQSVDAGQRPDRAIRTDDLVASSRVPADAASLDRADAIVELEARLASQARAHADLIHLLAHEFRTPITVINGFSRLLMDESQGSLTPRQKKFVAESLKACGRLDRLVADLLEASPESGSSLSIRPETSDIDASIRSTLDALAPLVEDREIGVAVDLDGKVPDLTFDPARIEQVLTNLLMNAIHHGRKGGSLRIGRHSLTSSGSDFVEVYVEDDGPGIAEADRRRVFEPYVRGEGRSVCSGFGIGLALCQRIVRSHSGTIRVEEGSMGGARFLFTLPVASKATPE